MNKFRGVWIVDVDLELGQQVERELELLEDVDEVHFRRRLGSHRQHPVAKVLLLRLPAPAAFLLKVNKYKLSKCTFVSFIEVEEVLT